MFQVLRNAWKIADLRKKILYTLLIILIFRIGSYVSVPFVDMEIMKNAVASSAAPAAVTPHRRIPRGGSPHLSWPR